MEKKMENGNWRYVRADFDRDLANSSQVGCVR